MEERFSPAFPERFNLAHHLLDARVEEGHGSRNALLTKEGPITYAQVRAQANQVANVLRDAGLRAGDRVLLALPDGPELVAALFGALKSGAVAALANPELPAHDHGYLLDYTGARALFASSALATRAQETIRAARSLALCSVVGDDPAGFEPFARCADAPDRFENAVTRRDDVAMWLFTSGSTGQPKAALHHHQDFAYHIECYARRVLALGPSDITLAVPRLYFPYATGMNLFFPFAVGGSAILLAEHPTAEKLFAALERFRPTVLSTVPTMTAKLLDAAGERRRALSCLRLCVTAGEALPPELHRRWNETVGVEMLDGIGSAEMFHIYISNRPGDVRPGGLGRVTPGYRARVVRADGTDTHDGEVGTLWVTGGSVFAGYHGDAEKTRAVIRDGWVVSGDFFRREPGGYFYYEGRADDMLKVGGIYVSPLEVENAIAAHPAVAECAVVGFDDEHGLTKPRAFVVVKPGTVANESLFEELAAWLRARLAHYKVPRSWVACPSLPRNDRGKIVRRMLRNQ